MVHLLCEWAKVCMSVRLYEYNCVMCANICGRVWEHVWETVWMQLCACVQMFVHMCVSVCVSAWMHLLVWYIDLLVHTCVCVRVCAHACTWSLIMKSKQRKVSSELWQERDPQPSHPDENIPFLFWRTSVGRDHFWTTAAETVRTAASCETAWTS